MLVDVSDIKKKRGSSKNIQRSVMLEAFDYKGKKISFDKNLNLSLTLLNTGEYIHAEGKVNAVLEVNCDRCLKHFKMSFSFDIDENFSESPNENDVLPIKNDKIDLKRAIMNSLLLNLPIKFICNEACRGLCPYCGKNLNEEECKCDVDDTDPRFAALKKLFNDKDE